MKQLINEYNNEKALEFSSAFITGVMANKVYLIITIFATGQMCCFNYLPTRY